jgi:pyrroloquinoline-quinone synthase
MDSRAFLQDLRREVAAHAAVGHSLLGRCKIDPRERDDFRLFSGQHYPLVATFTRYLEALLVGAPTSEAKAWLAKVLVDEYGERSAGQDHAAHYRVFMRACGWAAGAEESVPLHPAVPAFIDDHLRMCIDGPFLVGLGAVGPGHEWAIPAMFAELIRGLERAGFSAESIAYFTLHTVQDVDHAAWLEEALERFATTEQAQQQIRQGCLLSLAARERLWWGIAEVIFSGQARRRFPLLAGSGSGAIGSAGASADAEPAGETYGQAQGRWQLRLERPR